MTYVYQGDGTYLCAGDGVTQHHNLETLKACPCCFPMCEEENCRDCQEFEGGMCRGHHKVHETHCCTLFRRRAA